MKTLHEIGMKHNTNKAWWHGFLHFYPLYLEPMREKPIKLLELGIGKEAASAKMWDGYFTHPDSCFVMVDKDPTKVKNSIQTPRWNNIEMNVRHIKKLKKLGEKLGPFDFIFDDCIHSPESQEKIFKALWPSLKPGGVYFMEDIGHSYLRNRKKSVHSFLTEKLEEFVPKPEWTGIKSAIYFSHFYEHVCVIGRRNDI